MGRSICKMLEEQWQIALLYESMLSWVPPTFSVRKMSKAALESCREVTLELARSVLDGATVWRSASRPAEGGDAEEYRFLQFYQGPSFLARMGSPEQSTPEASFWDRECTLIARFEPHESEQAREKLAELLALYVPGVEFAHPPRIRVAQTSKLAPEPATSKVEEPVDLDELTPTLADLEAALRACAKEGDSSRHHFYDAVVVQMAGHSTSSDIWGYENFCHRADELLDRAAEHAFTVHYSSTLTDVEECRVCRFPSGLVAIVVWTDFDQDRIALVDGEPTEHQVLEALIREFQGGFDDGQWTLATADFDGGTLVEGETYPVGDASFWRELFGF